MANAFPSVLGCFTPCPLRYAPRLAPTPWAMVANIELYLHSTKSISFSVDRPEYNPSPVMKALVPLNACFNDLSLVV